jgi:hypothetical protein
LLVLYLSIVLLATLAALPSGTEAGADGHGASGVHGLQLVSLIWGTTIGLTLAHWFAFRLTARAFGGGKITEDDFYVGLAMIAGAIFVAAVCTVPVLLIGDSKEVQATTVVPGVIVGIAGYFTAKAGGRTRTQALILGGIVMLLGLTVASVKNFVLGH